MNNIKLQVTLAISYILGVFLSGFVCANTIDNYPKICNLNIGAPVYYDQPSVIQQLAKADITLLGFYRNWESDRKRLPGSMRSTVQKIKAFNPDILIGQYTILNEAPDGSQASPDSDKAEKINEMDWWVEGLFGQKMQWTKKYGKYDVNFTMFSSLDADGRRYPEWLAARDYDVYFSKVPEFDIWFLDNVFGQSKIALANWSNSTDIQLQTAGSVQTAYRAGHLAEWQAIRSINPNILLIGNVDGVAYETQEYSNQLNGAVLEAMMGLKWSTETLKGWPAMMQRYHNAFAHLLAPKLVVFNVHGKLNDYQLMRFGLTSTLMNDGLFSYSELNGNYRAVPWFDEFDIDLGQPLESPQLSPWQSGIYRRAFEKGVVFVNPTNKAVSVPNKLNLVRLKGKQVPATNNGKSVGASINLPARDGLILLKSN
ncbi:hypothetical protein A1359_11695 [Methylomonas lenta]|uniref:Glycoside hydrolase family 42 N-terminal domain-containing protein n=1 Tax=Methylomonas lenta TaxID=980561 RepID=A0A177N9K4_9GAMM|nr:putative glycoside hydrolase [Methylomonas lenta]OAI13770.1 hypothetical protein A1359_11695 [Methylomonas lenta]